jgi:hypothetical protein
VNERREKKSFEQKKNRVWKRIDKELSYQCETVREARRLFSAAAELTFFYYFPPVINIHYGHAIIGMEVFT